MAEITISTEIDGTKRQVWDVFNHLPGYENWNPFIVDAVGTIRHDATLKLKIVTKSGAVRAFQPHVETIETGSRVTWSTGNPLFSRETTFRISESQPGRSVFTTEIKFKGLTAPFRKGFADELESGYRNMAEALKNRVETEKKT